MESMGGVIRIDRFSPLCFNVFINGKEALRLAVFAAFAKQKTAGSALQALPQRPPSPVFPFAGDPARKQAKETVRLLTSLRIHL